MTLQEKAREWRENFEMRVLGGPVGEIKHITDIERLARDFDNGLTALLESVRREAIEECAKLADGSIWDRRGDVTEKPLRGPGEVATAIRNLAGGPEK